MEEILYMIFTGVVKSVGDNSLSFFSEVFYRKKFAWTRRIYGNFHELNKVVFLSTKVFHVNFSRYHIHKSEEEKMKWVAFVINAFMELFKDSKIHKYVVPMRGKTLFTTYFPFFLCFFFYYLMTFQRTLNLFISVSSNYVTIDTKIVNYLRLYFLANTHVRNILVLLFNVFPCNSIFFLIICFLVE